MEVVYLDEQTKSLAFRKFQRGQLGSHIDRTLQGLTGRQSSSRNSGACCSYDAVCPEMHDLIRFDKGDASENLKERK